MVVRIRIHANGKGLTKRYLFQDEPTAKSVMHLINEEYPGYSVIGWAQESHIMDTVCAWCMKQNPACDMDLIKLDDSEASYRGVPFAFIYQEEETVRIYFYNYNFHWGFKNGVQ